VCENLYPNQNYLLQNNIKAFGQLNSLYMVDIEKFNSDCTKYFSRELCINDGTKAIIKNLNIGLMKNFSGTSSAFAIKTNRSSTLMMTSGHSCKSVQRIDKNIIELIEQVTFGGTNKITLGIMKLNFVIDSRGNKYKFKRVLYTNEKPDICLFKVAGKFPNTVYLSDRKPTIGDKLLNISSPFGILNKQAVGIFEGYYLGKFDGEILYSIPAAPGSSGSPVFLNGFLTGVIHSVNRKFDQLSFGVSHEMLKEIIELE
tara:strand:- start:122 stop:892 length:771 start_codon:yes stop_codon:yes gene_type:complete